jgi:hypothetical protein
MPFFKLSRLVDTLRELWKCEPRGSFLFTWCLISVLLYNLRDVTGLRAKSNLGMSQGFINQATTPQWRITCSRHIGDMTGSLGLPASTNLSNIV